MPNTTEITTYETGNRYYMVDSEGYGFVATGDLITHYVFPVPPRDLPDSCKVETVPLGDRTYHLTEMQPPFPLSSFINASGAAVARIRAGGEITTDVLARIMNKYKVGDITDNPKLLEAAESVYHALPVTDGKPKETLEFFPKEGTAGEFDEPELPPSPVLPPKQPAPKRSFTSLPSRREMIRDTLLGGAALGAGWLRARMLDSEASRIDQHTRTLANPIRMLEPCKTDSAATLKKLRDQGYNLFCIADTNHASFAASRTAHTILSHAEELGIDSYLIEHPEPGKSNPKTFEVLGNVTYQQTESPGQVEGAEVHELLKDTKAKGRPIPQYPTDSHLGPDHEKFLVSIQADHGTGFKQVMARLECALDGRAVDESTNRDIIFRNMNMAEAIRGIVSKQKSGQNKSSLFQVGGGHMEGKDNVISLLEKAAVPGLKIAVIDALPVKSSGMDAKLWHVKGTANRFVMTYDDPVNGYDLSAKNTVTGYIWYQFPPTRNQSKEK